MVRRLMLLAAAALMLVPFLAAPAEAQYNGVSASVNKPLIEAGDTIRVSASGFQRRTDVTIYFDGIEVETSSVRRNGKTSILIDVPEGLAPGTVVTVTVVGEAKGDGTQTATTTFTIKDPNEDHGHGHHGHGRGHGDGHGSYGDDSSNGDDASLVGYHGGGRGRG